MDGVEAHRVKAPHGDGGGNTDYRNQRAKRDPKQTHAPMPLHFAGTHQSGLHNEEDQPTREYSCVNIKDPWARHSWMDKVLAYGEAEAVYDHRNDHERHKKIEVFCYSAARRDGDTSRAGLTNAVLLRGGDHELRVILPHGPRNFRPDPHGPTTFQSREFSTCDFLVLAFSETDQHSSRAA